MKTTLRAGAAYFMVVFALGFLLGTVRTLVLAPAFGPLLAVTIELPLMLAASWFVCGQVIERFAVDRRLADRAVMGLFAFALLILAESALSALLFGRSLSEYLALYTRPETALGLVGQIMFAGFPLIMHRKPG